MRHFDNKSAYDRIGQICKSGRPGTPPKIGHMYTYSGPNCKFWIASLESYCSLHYYLCSVYTAVKSVKKSCLCRDLKTTLTCKYKFKSRQEKATYIFQWFREIVFPYISGGVRGSLVSSNYVNLSFKMPE